MADPTIVKISVNLTEDAVEALKDLAAKRGTTVTDVLRRAISTEKYLDHVQREEGSKVLVEDKKGKIRELVFQR